MTLYEDLSNFASRWKGQLSNKRYAQTINYSANIMLSELEAIIVASESSTSERKPVLINLNRTDSLGKIHTTCVDDTEVTDKVRDMFGNDSVQVSTDGRFKIGQYVRPTKRYIQNVLLDSIPYGIVEYWNRGFPITEIGPPNFPFPNEHYIECEGLDMMILDTTLIEQVVNK